MQIREHKKATPIDDKVIKSLKTKNYHRGSLINALLDYHYSEKPEETEYINENRY